MTFKSLFGDLRDIVIRQTIVVLMFLATVLFLWGVIQFLMHPDNEEVRARGKQHMIWGVLALFVAVTMWGIVRVLCNTLQTCLPVSF